MRGPGLFSMLQFAAGLSMAGPMFVIGFEFARTGQVALGVGFFALGALVSYAPTYFLRRIGGPRTWIRRRLRRRRSDEEERRTVGAATADADRDDTGERDAATERDGRPVRLRRFRDRFSRR